MTRRARLLSSIVLTALPLLVAALGVAKPATAAATAAPRAGHKPGPMVRMADLRCEIQAYQVINQRRDSVDNGSSMPSNQELVVELTIENRGGLDANNFTNLAFVKNDGTSVYASNGQLSIPAGATITLPVVKVPGNLTGTKVVVKVNADTGHAVRESYENNNLCQFSADWFEPPQ